MPQSIGTEGNGTAAAVQCRFIIILFLTMMIPPAMTRAAETVADERGNEGSQSLSPPLEKAPPRLWEEGVGEGFRSDVESFNVGLGAAYGLAAFGGHQSHDLALLNLEYGHMLSHTLGRDHWFRGNLELRFELFSGAEFSPSTEWVVGLTPHLRYDFATGTKWIPFFDLGAGVTATSIGPPDLSNYFEFNLQAGAGVHRMLGDNVALTLEARYMHMSCAGLSSPNAGLNSVLGLLGVTWFF